MKLKLIACFLLHAAACTGVLACDTPASVCGHDMGGSFGLVRAGRPAAVVVEAGADPALQHLGRSFVADLARVSGQPAALLDHVAGAPREIVLIGELGRSPAIDGLLARGQLKAEGLKGQWEAFRQVVVDQPFKGVDRALVIVGSDRRGAVFGGYDLSARIGVSPWHWWADVPVARKADVFVTAGARDDQPQVKYRGIFINDEAPALSTWAQAKFGGTRAAFYEHVFELILRLRGNYLWPAMWQPRAFAADDPKAMVLADEMGVVMGTSHHEPMMRAHDEWTRFNGGAWDYAKNADKLREFWRGGVRRMAAKPGGGSYDSLVTIGMRGDGDEPMSEGTATALLEGIVADQRQILADVTGKPAAQTPQMWALYKEVQDYYDKGMKVPDDVLLLFCDDNWGQVRRLPERGARRPGGYGVYYHFDYVGGPRSYKWLNTNQIEKTWQQMNLVHEHGADALWIVNVGDIKPMEFPISFFLDMAWSPERMTPAALATYPRDWAAATFGPALADEIGDIVTRYSQYAARRKPELVDANSFRLGAASTDTLDGGEFGQRVAEWSALEARVATAKAALRADQLDAYFQLVEHPVLAMANLYRLYFAVAWNQRLAKAGDPRANVFADRAEAAFARDQAIADRYHAIAGGKWAGMMLQTHIGYTNWQQPDRNVMPGVQRVAGAAPDAAAVQQQLDRATPAPSRAITLEASKFSRAINGRGLTWSAIPNLGHGLGAVTALPQGRAATTLADGVRLEYDVDVERGGDMNLELSMLPTLDTRNAGGIRVAVGIDDRPAQELKLNLQPTAGPELTRAEKDWAQAVKDNQFSLGTRLADVKAGRHVIRVWRLDDNAVLQKLVLAPLPSAAVAPRGAANTGHYRNLLREVRPDITEADISAKLAAYWQSLFEGDGTHRVVYPAPATADGPASYVLDVGNADVRSEGMSYGMMIAVQMGRKAEFDALWNWAATHMRYTAGPRAGYFRWQCKPAGCDRDAVPASDGEAYFATALLMASSRWGNGQGLYDYNAQAQALLDTMLHKERMNGGIVDGVHSMFSPERGQVVFVPIGDAAGFTDPSYHLPAFYDLWARRAAKAEDRRRWAEIADISRAYFSAAAHPKTALTPDYAEFDGRPHRHEGHEDFRYDAFRTAVNWSVDQVWWDKNPAAAGLSRKLLGFFASHGAKPYPHLYRLDGTPLNDEPSSGLIASNAVAALLVDKALAERFVNDLWALEPPSGPWRYYNGLLQFMAMLHVTGRFRAW
ncbi:MAG: glycosyl hydrolase 115 family protein [Burkholderiales bacterium]|nr:glycosyl hydrolase 115 family protein [Burkholderiales bacterium]